MKFIKLKLAAFLSFKDRTEINFAQFSKRSDKNITHLLRT